MVGARVRINNTTNFMEGQITAYTTTTLTVNVDLVGGSGTFAAWTFDIAGQSGISGYSGSNGTNGTSGFSGYSGISGSNGTNGTSGFSGWSGYSGTNGATGTSGFSGWSGISGTNGATGTSGFSGWSGTNGATGTSGFSGWSGISGTNGATGTSGFSGYSGPGANQTVNTTSNVQFNSLGVGTAGSATTGEIRATNNVTAFYTSDRQFKENIEDIPNALEIVDAIGGKFFDWTESYIKAHGGTDEYFLHKQDFGVIAQDVQAVFPRGVRIKPDGSLAVDYEKLVALAFAAIKELKARI